MTNKVAIILSTYNGGQYIEEQLESLLNQAFKDIEIFIHDDGSKDDTVSKIKKFEEKNSCIHMVEGSGGCGYPACFINLLHKVEGFNYYAFCDQDDVWLPHKIDVAVKQLAKEDGEKPLLYYTAVEYCDSELKHIRDSRFADGKSECMKVTLQEMLFGGEAMGMTFVFNQKAREALLRANQVVTFKDWFLKIYCAACGVVYYDPKPSAKYRRHNQAVTVKTNPVGKLARYIGQIQEIFFAKSGFENQKKIINYLENWEPEEISPENKALIQLFSEPNSCGKCLRKVFWKKRFRSKLLDEIGYRFAFLLWRI